MKHPYKLGRFMAIASASTKPLPEAVRVALDNSIRCYAGNFANFQHFHSKAFALMRGMTGLDLAFYLEVPRAD
jgi:hypothetical protein